MMEENHEMKTGVKEENHEMKIEKENHEMKTEVKEENHEMKIEEEEEENQKMKIEEDESHEMKTEVKQEENEEVKVEEHQDQEPDLHPVNTTNQTDPASSSGPPDLQVGKMTQKRKAPANEDTDEVVKKRLAYDPSGPSVSTSSSQEADSIDLQIDDTATRIGAAPALLDISSVSGLEIVVMLDGHDNKTVDKSCQTDTKCEEMTRLKVENHILKKKLSNFDLLTATTQQKPFFSVDDVKNDDKQFQFYTGLTWIQFMALWNFLGPAKDDLTYYKSSKPEKSPSERPGVKRKLDPINELFLTLIRLRSGLLLNDLAYRFGISVSLVSKIVMTWIQFLYLELSKLKKPMFATRETVARTLPSCFKKFEGIRTIIDCTEFFVEQASNFEQQDNFCSSYKSRRIYKVLIAVSPSGSIMFVSDAYEGSISDVEIVKQSGFLDHLKAGDLVVAGKGFTIRDILKEKGVNLHTLPSLKGRKKLTPGEEIYTKQMARVRLHVKRSIESIKKFRLLGKVIPLSLQPLFSKMVFVAGCLVNFQEPAAT
ncbi:uncharacterized protein LOC105923908 isoform X2 [Fundulus heteroclitus]|uniref:uncharacterized protein LOC105923908 isoform X2 n=1 Tax=Fundulus heteroclitus TaxID=8078 RepID=UPI00165C5342|nr:uncharacterized protein LOC105923908 isoform X2 [Fundulus heteroclitus]